MDSLILKTRCRKVPAVQNLFLTIKPQSNKTRRNTMKKLTIKICALFCVLTLFAVVAISSAQDTKDDIKLRMKNRFAQIRELKKSGKIGETPSAFSHAASNNSARAYKI